MKTKVVQPDLLAKVKEIEPILRQYAPEAEENRRLSEPVVEAMKEAGFFGMWRPKSWGGLEVDPITGFKLLENLANIDSAAGWNLQISAAIDIILQWFPDETMKEVFGSVPAAALAGTFHPPGQAIEKQGGYEISGQWTISSGCHYADWFFLNAVILDGDQPKTYDNGQPVIIYLLVPAQKGQIVDTWDTIGMRGTGSNDISLDKVFVPSHHTTPMVPIDQPPGKSYQGPLYRNSVWYAVAVLAAPALGIARAAMDDIIDLVKHKVPNLTSTLLQDNQVVQMKLAEAEAILNAGRAYIYEVMNSSWETAKQGHRITTEQRMQVQLASTYTIQSCARTVRIVHDIAGVTAMRESSNIQRYFRDIHVITQHAFISTNRYQAVGQLMIDLEPNWPFFYF